MKNFNSVTLIGRALERPELKNEYCNFTIRVDRKGSKAQDDIPVYAQLKLATLCADYITKNSLVLISGTIMQKAFEGLIVMAESLNVLEYNTNREE